MAVGRKPKRKGSPGVVRSPRAGSKFRRLPGGGYEGRPVNKSKMRTIKKSPRVKTTKRGTKVTKRKYGKKI